MLISLVREHTEQMNPPRALWVPFDLGRPMGAPDAPEFQRRVLETGLGLLARDNGPVLEDFPDDAPGEAPGDMSGWVCPVNLAPATDEADGLLQALTKEMTALRPWHELNYENKSRTVVGVGGIEIEAAAKLVADFIENQETPSPREDRPLPAMLKFSAEDLKAWYYEAATAQPGASGGELSDWFWRETAAGSALLKMAAVMRGCESKGLQALGGKGIVPRSYESLVPAVED